MSRARRRVVLSPFLPVLFFLAGMPMWLQQSVLSSIRDGLIAPTVPIKEMRKQSIEPIGNEITVEVVTAFNGGTMTNQPLLSNTRPAVNVLYGLSGSGRDFMAEFEISLKSVLLNAPLNMDLNVHVLADSKAYSSVGKILQSAKLKGSSWPTQITIHVYNVSPYVNKWSNVVSKLYQKKIGRVTRHTIGAYFRLFSNEVLPQSVEHVVYMDTDVVVMANLGDLWRRIDRNATYTWGKDHCSGFVVFNVKKIPTIWKMAKEYPFKKYASGDQFILKQVGKLHPEVVKYLPSEWAISVANGGLWRRAKHIVEYRPKVGMFHFNGQGARKASWFKNKNGFPYKHEKTFGAALYYVNLPWSWARYQGASLAEGGHKYKLAIRQGNKKSTSEKENGVKDDTPEAPAVQKVDKTEDNVSKVKVESDNGSVVSDDLEDNDDANELDMEESDETDGSNADGSVDWGDEDKIDSTDASGGVKSNAIDNTEESINGDNGLEVSTENGSEDDSGEANESDSEEEDLDGNESVSENSDMEASVEDKVSGFDKEDPGSKDDSGVPVSSGEEESGGEEEALDANDSTNANSERENSRLNQSDEMNEVESISDEGDDEEAGVESPSSEGGGEETESVSDDGGDDIEKDEKPKANEKPEVDTAMNAKIS